MTQNYQYLIKKDVNIRLERRPYIDIFIRNSIKFTYLYAMSNMLKLDNDRII